MNNKKIYELEKRIKILEDLLIKEKTLYCEHKYPNPWAGISPPCCIKCGLPASTFLMR